MMVMEDMELFMVGGRLAEEDVEYGVEDFSDGELDEFGTQVMWSVVCGEVGSEGEVVAGFNEWANGRAKITLENDAISYQSRTLLTGVFGISNVPGVGQRKRKPLN